MDYAFVIEKHSEHLLDIWHTHACWGNPISPTPTSAPSFQHHNPCLIVRYICLIARYDVLKEIVIVVGTVSSFWLISTLFLLVNQQTRNEFCIETMHIKFVMHNLMAWFYADANFASN